MLVTLSWIAKNYKIFNQKYWNGELPENLTFDISRSKHTWGYASYRYDLSQNKMWPIKLTLSNYYDSPEQVKLNTLLHEMVHIADYYFHPEHFIRNGRKVRYDAHGPIFFLKEAARLNQDGWDIQKFVQKWEEEQSQLSQHQQDKFNTLMNNGGISFFLMQLPRPMRADNGKYYNFKYRQIYPKNVQEYTNYAIAEYNRGSIVWCDKYISKSQAAYDLRQLRGINRCFLTDDIEKVKQTYDLQFVESVVGNNDANAGKIPVFMLKLMTANGPKIVEFKNLTEDELREKLKETFPKWSDEVIEKKIQDDANYPQGKGQNLNENMKQKRIKLSENEFKKIIRKKIQETIDEDAINEMGESDQTDPMVHDKKLSPYEGIISIE